MGQLPCVGRLATLRPGLIAIPLQSLGCRTRLFTIIKVVSGDGAVTQTPIKMRAMFSGRPQDIRSGIRVS